MSDPGRAALFMGGPVVPAPEMASHAQDTQSNTSTSSITPSGHNHPSSPRTNLAQQMPLELYNQNHTPRILASTDNYTQEPYPMPASRTATLQTLSEDDFQEWLEWRRLRDAQNANNAPRNMRADHNQRATTRNGRTDSTYGSDDDTGTALLPSQYRAENMRVQPHAPPENHVQPYNNQGAPQQFPPWPQSGHQHMSQFVSVRPGHRFGTVTAGDNARVVRGNVVRDLNEDNPYTRQHEFGNATINGSARVFDGDVTHKEMEGFWNN